MVAWLNFSLEGEIIYFLMLKYPKRKVESFRQVYRDGRFISTIIRRCIYVVIPIVVP